jgi:hypothetical protein
VTAATRCASARNRTRAALVAGNRVIFGQQLLTSDELTVRRCHDLTTMWAG